MALKQIQGNLITLAQQGHFDVIAHGCNCFCSMSAGIAKAIQKAFPAAYAADLATLRGDRSKLGTCSEAQCGGVVVVNAYTQVDYSGKGVLVDYDAVASCMAWIKERHSGKRIGLPMIGAGMARGDWQEIQSIIEEELAGEDVTVVVFGGA